VYVFESVRAFLLRIADLDWPLARLFRQPSPATPTPDAPSTQPQDRAPTEPDGQTVEDAESLWHPIALAPRDGTPILLWDPHASLRAYSDDPRWGSTLINGGATPTTPLIGFWNGHSWQLAHYPALTFSPTLFKALPLSPAGG
jgi:hypothetical protein